MKTHDDQEKYGKRLADVKSAGPEAAQRIVDNRPIATIQKTLQRMANQAIDNRQSLQRVENKTGMPDQLKSGIESLSGYSLDPVKVHYNSPKPAAVQAHAYAQGSNIHLGPGQEKHLPHEAWHVVQQMQGRVKPTTKVNGQAVNDNGGLEREADEMGSKARQLKAAPPGATLQSKSLSGEAIQRKDATKLTALTADPPFDTADWTEVRAAIVAYNNIADDDKVYAVQKQQLQAIETLGAAKYVSSKSKYQLDQGPLIEQKEQLEKELLELEGKKSDNGDLLSRLRKQRANLQQQQQQQQIGIDTTPSNAVRLNAKMDEINESLRVVQQDIADQELADTEVDDQKRSKREEISQKEEEVRRLVHCATELDLWKQNFIDAELTGELVKVQGQMSAPATSKVAEFAPIDTAGKKILIKSRPAELNSLADKFKTAADDNTKFTIVLEMQDYIESWKADYVEGGQIKASITDQAKRTDREKKYAGIKLMEEQLIHTQKALYDALFAPNAYGDAEPEGSVKTGFDATSDFVEEGAKDTGSVKKVFKESLGETTKAGLSGAASGADGLVQIYKLINIGIEFKEQGGKERLLSVLEGLESLGTGISDGATLAMSIGGENLEGAESTATWTEGLAEAIGGLRSAIMGVISLIKAFKRRGIDPEHARENALKGGMSLVSAAGSAAKAAKVFFEVAEKTVPPSLLSAIPALGIAVNAATMALSLYQGYQGAKKEKGLKTKMSTFLEVSTDPVTGLVAQTNLSTEEVNKITHLESRGVYGKAGGKNYLRFNAYVMAKIDDHDFSTGDLVINIDGAGDTVTISKADSLKNREYEYISKMTEINQKRKVRGIDNTAHALVSMVGDITTLSGVGALVGTSLKAAASGSKVAHSVAIGGQQISRNRQRTALEESAGANIAAIGSQKAYSDAFPTSWGRTKVDKSRKQKETEYRRHAAYVLERLSLIPAPASPTDYSNSITAYNEAKELIKVTGVDYYDFLKSANLKSRFDLLVAAQKSSG